ncbi:transposase [Modicisalibacter xianhensis]|uniref:Transposase C of IS166 homeodomain-containing protein n=1 Tax=Modicisalibacter xianhensis TaxID=442341 RepID=A0A1I3AZS8_9GAMM|nr:transposase [Halomonas xianhensis]SFH55482.1 Transposase C of IS166 homeodomain-containing protein [Halomonas xianhensis]
MQRNRHADEHDPHSISGPAISRSTPPPGGNSDIAGRGKGTGAATQRTINQKLTDELALLKRHAFGKRSKQLNVLQISLLDKVVDADIAAIETEMEDLVTPDTLGIKNTQSAPLAP